MADEAALGRRRRCSGPAHGAIATMKQIKSSLGDLRRLFDRALTLRDIAEPLVSFDVIQPAEEVQALMESRGFDVVGVRDSGVVTGFCLRRELGPGVLGTYRRPFAVGDVLPDSEPLLAAFETLRERRHVFVTVFGQAGGIVTRGDLQKAPVRLWLFGLVSLLEMQMLRVVRERYPLEAWTGLLSPERLEGAHRVHAERRRRNEENDLSDCLQLGDKATVLMKDDVLFSLSGFDSRRSAETFFKEVGLLRNALAHANDVMKGRWPGLADLVTQLEGFLARLESAAPGPATRGGA